MLIFRTKHDLEQLAKTDPAYSIIRDRLSDLTGDIILIEENDVHTPIDLPQVKGRLENISWEGVIAVSGHYIAIRLAGNSGYVLEFILADADWLPPDIRANLVSHIS